MNLLARCRAYAGHPDPAAAATNVVALVVALNGPFYPLYIIGLIGWAGVSTFATMLSSPLFFAVPWLSRRSSLAGRVALPLIGTINTVCQASECRLRRSAFQSALHHARGAALPRR